jgi:hypothetical protein
MELWMNFMPLDVIIHSLGIVIFCYQWQSYWNACMNLHNRSLKVAVLGPVFGPPLYIHATLAAPSVKLWSYVQEYT